MKRPSFPFYPADFLADENVVVMSNQALGCYMKLICFCWREGSIPASVERIAKLCQEDSTAMALLWPAIGTCFETSPVGEHRLVHPRLEATRLEQDEYHKGKSNAGKAGAKSRWDKEKHNNSSAIVLPIASDDRLPLANDGLSLALSSSLKKKRKRSPEGSRIPDGFPSEAEIAWARTERADKNAANESLLFRDHFLAKAGKDGRKADWPATWRGWIRRDFGSKPVARSKPASAIKELT